MSSDEQLKPCPFCGGSVLFRAALWPSDGDTDGIIHAQPTSCPMVVFDNGKSDGSLIAVWNKRHD